MTIYVDRIQTHGNKGEWCHMWTDDFANLDKLHQFADSIGLKRKWFQSAPNSMPHYDLRPSKRKQAIEKGARHVVREVLVYHIQEWRKFKNETASSGE